MQETSCEPKDSISINKRIAIILQNYPSDNCIVNTCKKLIVSGRDGLRADHIFRIFIYILRGQFPFFKFTILILPEKLNPQNK